MYIPGQATAFPHGLHNDRCIGIKMVPNKAYIRLPMCDEGKKKGFKLYFNKEMPSRG